jgi:hypothetical protein
MSYIKDVKQTAKFANYTLTIAQDDKLEIWTGSWRDGYKMIADGKLEGKKIVIEGKYPKEYHIPRAVLRNLERVLLQS